MAAFQSGLFFYSKEHNCMSVDMSELDRGDMTMNVFHELKGGKRAITIVSDRTETAVEFVVKYGPTENVPFWELEPTYNSMAKTPECKGIRVLIINS